ncbi:MAG: hypothetical protein Q3959_06125 [Limosilactobacillus sp.]|uniref:hypothetical protein n=1 Tax=Limosilactobacillus sp. TaxID=2773925 RepID=UPI0026F79858|nr:hypothetical protein [Limosilactobacillus sp.]
MAIALSNKQEGQLIIKRIDKAFVNLSRQRYWISVVSFAPINGYTMFFYTLRPGEYTRSVPIARLSDRNFNQLIAILKTVRTKYQFTFHYTGFTRQERRILYEEVDR